jgi:hypothetical protein
VCVASQCASGRVFLGWCLQVTDTWLSLRACLYPDSRLPPKLLKAICQHTHLQDLCVSCQQCLDVVDTQLKVALRAMAWLNPGNSVCASAVPDSALRIKHGSNADVGREGDVLVAVAGFGWRGPQVSERQGPRVLRSRGLQERFRGLRLDSGLSAALQGARLAGVSVPASQTRFETVQ